MNVLQRPDEQSLCVNPSPRGIAAPEYFHRGNVIMKCLRHFTKQISKKTFLFIAPQIIFDAAADEAKEMAFIFHPFFLNVGAPVEIDFD